MHRINTDIYTFDQAQKYHGLEVGTRMTVIRLAQRKLLLISPVKITDAIAEALAGLGEVSFIVAPNLYHHLYLQACAQRYPQAMVYTAPGLAQKYPQLTCTELSTNSPSAWKDYVDQVLFDGYAVQEIFTKVKVNEVVFFHKPSNTLIVTDAAYHFCASSPWLNRLFAKLIGVYAVLGPTFMEKFATKRRVDAAKAMRTILNWPFETVIMAHGEIVKDNAKQKLATGYGWLLN